MFHRVSRAARLASAAALALVVVAGSAGVAAARLPEPPAALRIARAPETAQSTPFKGVKANTGHATRSREGRTILLTLSDDFQVPDAPAPHWQVVDSRGNTYLLQRLIIKGDKYHKQIAVPSYVRDVQKVQIWCAYAEALLGEASF